MFFFFYAQNISLKICVYQRKRVPKTAKISEQKIGNFSLTFSPLSLTLFVPLSLSFSLTSSQQNFTTKNNKSNQFIVYALCCVTRRDEIFLPVKRYLILFSSKMLEMALEYWSQESSGNEHPKNMVTELQTYSYMLNCILQEASF